MTHHDDLDTIPEDIVNGFKILNIPTASQPLTFSQQYSRFKEFSMYEPGELSASPHSQQLGELKDAKLE